MHRHYEQLARSRNTSSFQDLCVSRLRIKRLWLASCTCLLGVAWLNQAIGAPQNLHVAVVDAQSKQPLAARLYLRSLDGQSYYFAVNDPAGSAVKYEKRNWINTRSFEHHTTISAHSAHVALEPGRYELIIERGKEYHPVTEEIVIQDDDIQLTIPLQRWFNAAEHGWFSGDTHIHRTIEELKNVIVAEDLNVALPLTYWVTRSHTPPAAGDKNLSGELPSGLINIDATHVIWPRNTEYEIFTVGPKRHTLGALFVLGHTQPLDFGVPNWEPIIKSTRTSSVLYDMDKLDWPFAMLLPVLAPQALYELANNHMWRTEFAFEKWNSAAPSFMVPPFGKSTGGEREWIDYTHAMYYSLLNCGLRLPPSAGTANGVHPVPAGFGRVYVQLDGDFTFQNWLLGLQQGRSFVTTGPMLLARADAHYPGHVFRVSGQENAVFNVPVEIEVTSQSPILYGELLINGEPTNLLRFSNTTTPAGGYHSSIKTTANVNRSGWFAVRVWEPREDQRIRFAHTAPWYVDVNNAPVQIPREQQEYLVTRMRQEIERSSQVLDQDALDEYQRALAFYHDRPVVDDANQVQRNSRPLAKNRLEWLDNMIVHHRYSAHEVRSATGLALDAAQHEIELRNNRQERQDALSRTNKILVLPYPAGRHPRRGFLDGAIDPQRETKFSAFAPWKDGGYAVVDVPEAIFSNLGLTYLAHTHVRTIWEERQVSLERLEWETEGTALRFERTLPNGIRFGSRIEPTNKEVRMSMWLTNGTSAPLTGLRAQVCTMLKGMPGFNSQTSAQVHLQSPFIALRHENLARWVVVGWTPNQREWNNPPVPCIHSDPIFPNCDPGRTVRVAGALWFYEGEQIERFIEENCRPLLREMTPANDNG